MVKALASWDNNDLVHPMLVWWPGLDGRWQIEVHRVNDYNGALCIFDHPNENKLPHNEPVAPVYEAICGPDVSNIAFWQGKAIGVVHSISSVQ